MLNLRWKRIGLIIGLSLTLAAAGCGQGDTNDSSGNGQTDASTSVSEAVDYTITGIEPGAGITSATEQAMSEYENLAGWELETSSTAGMLTQLGEAIDNEEPIILTGWNPHYKFAQWDLKYLEDPKGVYEEEDIITIARNGLQEEIPEAYTILDRIQFDVEEMEAALLQGQEVDFDYEIVAQDWVEQNPERVAEWTEGVEPVDGTEITLATTLWDEILFSTNVAKVVLEQQGFDVTVTQVDPAILFESVASGDADASLAPWVPMTHGALYEANEGEFEDLGPNVTGVNSGLVVPSYMNIDSIEELEPNQ